MRTFLFEGAARRPIESLAPFLRLSLAHGVCINPELMRADDVARCRWVGWGLTKGVTHPLEGTTVLAKMGELVCGMHAQMLQGLPNIDPPEGCYDKDKRVQGFGGFIRWVYFAPKETEQQGIVGIDWSQEEPKDAGVARHVDEVVCLARHLANAGIDENSELVLLNCRMCEYPELTAWRHQHRLVSMSDWAQREVQMVWKNDSPDYPSTPVAPPPPRPPVRPRWKFCPNCGGKLGTDFKFCPGCGHEILKSPE